MSNQYTKALQPNQTDLISNQAIGGMVLIVETALKTECFLFFIVKHSARKMPTNGVQRICSRHDTDVFTVHLIFLSILTRVVNPVFF